MGIKVRNAVILAAGPSSRFVPLGLEKPKGLFEVKGEVLIERQIKQLLAAGIKDITIVLGYKKEAFYYLKDKYNVQFVFNPKYLEKNNIESLNLARRFIGDSYICSCDNYFVENPFLNEEEHAFYAVTCNEKFTKESKVTLDRNNRIISIVKGTNPYDLFLLGHSFWTKEFANKFFEIVDENSNTGKYDTDFWETLVECELERLPDFYAKIYKEGMIYEFDFVDEVREFDNEYIKTSNSRILANIQHVFSCNEKDIKDFRKVHEGLTNNSFVFNVNGIDYIYRHPGDGTESIISRANEKESLLIAKKYGFDPTVEYVNGEEGWKISKFVKDFREPDYESISDSKLIASTLRKLHNSKIKVNYDFEPIVEIQKLEKSIDKTKIDSFSEYFELKGNILKLYKLLKNDGVNKVFCHGDTYKSNWMILPNDEIYLIDWEYSGMADPGVDVGYYISDAQYDISKAILFIKDYLGDDSNKAKIFHHLVYTAIISFYWFVWSLYRESCGAFIGEAQLNWYSMAKKFSTELIENKDKYLESEQSNMNKNEFLVLTYIEKERQIPSVRELSTILGLSLGSISNAINSLKEKRLIDDNNITKDGLNALEPYRVSRLIILAAGFGSRLVPVTLERPKPLVRVNGVRMIDTMINAAINAGIKDIVIVRGYKKEKFDELLEDYPFIKLVDNDEYNVTNNISSAMKAIEYFDNAYICDSDLIIKDSTIFTKYQYETNFICTKVDETDDWCTDKVGRRITNYRKGGVNCYRTYVLSYFNREDSKLLREEMEKAYNSAGGKDIFWEFVPLVTVKNKFIIHPRVCDPKSIMEIDTFAELVEIDPSYKNMQ